MLLALYLALFAGGTGSPVTADMFLLEMKTAVVQIVVEADRQQQAVNAVEDLTRSLGDFRKLRADVSRTLEIVDADYGAVYEDYMREIRTLEKSWLDFETEVGRSHNKVTRILTDDEWGALVDHLKSYVKGKNQ
jgi:hypothetical protein